MQHSSLDTVRIRLVPGPTAPRLARVAVRKALPRVDSRVVERAMLLTSELVTNAVIHADTPVELTLRQHEGRLRVLVEDGNDSIPAPVPMERSGPHGGFGLHIVERLASAWGVAPRDNGKAVWFEVPLELRERGDAAPDDLQRAAG